MHLLQAVLMGIIQGLSEFLPISSSAHLVFTSNFYKVFKNIEITQVTEQEVFFDIMLHLGTLVAVLIFFRKDILKITKAFWLGLRKKEFRNPDFKIGCYIILGTILTAFVAVPLCEISEMLVFMPAGVGLFLVISGILSSWCLAGNFSSLISLTKFISFVMSVEFLKFSFNLVLKGLTLL